MHFPPKPASGSGLVRSDMGPRGSSVGPAVLPEPPCRIGAWTLRSRLGAGSNGVVYLAERDGLPRRFALKLLRPEGGADPESVARFRLEAAAASKVEDPGVIGVFEVGELGAFHFYAMEYCRGPTLKERLARDGPMEWREAARLVAALARTVAAAHRAGVLHRDLKPANVILEAETERPRITDFGLARAEDLSRSLTKSGDVVGTPLFMPPEVLRGDKGRDPRVDVYGLGAVLHCALTGRPPFDAPTVPALLKMHQQGEAAPPERLVESIPPGLSSICLRALRRDPARRTPTAEVLAGELEAFLVATPHDAPPRPARRRFGPLALGLLLVAVAVGSALTVVALLGSGGPAAPPPDVALKALASAPPPPAASVALPPVPPPPELPWGLAYYMPYDGSLSSMGEGIVAELADGLVAPGARVLVQADFEGPGGVVRYRLRARSDEGDRGERSEVLSALEGSAELPTFRGWLRWVEEELPARRLALVLLGPGGRLDQTCLDTHPTASWLSLPEVAAELADFRQRVRARGTEVELLFLQQGARGQLENFHALRGAARVVMASQAMIGAPNHYYRPALARLLREPDLDGRGLAGTIAELDRPTMFSAYSALDGAALEELPAHLDAVLEPLLACERIELDREGLVRWVTWNHGRDEVFVDGMALLRALVTENGLPRGPLERLERFVEERLVVMRRTSSAVAGDGRPVDEWCGFSLLLPRSAEELRRHDGHYPLLRGKLRELWLREMSR